MRLGTIRGPNNYIPNSKAVLDQHWPMVVWLVVYWMLLSNIIPAINKLKRLDIKQL